MGLDKLLATLEKRDSVTPVTSVTLDDVTLKPAWTKACTPVTPVTSQNDITAGAHFLWSVETADGAFQVATSPPSTLAEILLDFPDTVAATPIPLEATE